MTPNEKIIMFMEEKSNLIKNHFNTNSYFNDGDKAEILLEWSEESADKVWKQLKNNLPIKSLHIDSCPFCLYNKTDCSNCGYSKRHGKCSTNNLMNDFGKIIVLFSSAFELYEIFSEQFYNDLIKKIEDKSIINEENKKYLIKDKYEGLDPDVAKLLKEGKYVKGEFWNDGVYSTNSNHIGYLIDYDSFTLLYPYKTKDLRFRNFEPIFDESNKNIKSDNNTLIDWSNVHVDTKIYVSNNLSNWIPRYFVKFENNKFFVWKDGKTSFSAESNNSFEYWKYGKSVEEIEEMLKK
jgi:hypothetical protein